MTHDEAFLRDIAQNPADDAPRLIYADWLEEHGGAAETTRAAFIRAQCRLAGMSFQDPARTALEDECSDLLAEHGRQWTAPLNGITDKWEFSRGFIERIEISGEGFLKHVDALMKRLPLRAVALVLGDTGTALAACPYLERLETLEIRDQRLRDAVLQPLLASPHLKRLTALNLSGNAIEGPAIHALLQGNLLARLRKLDLHNNYSLGDRAGRALVTSPQAGSLEVLRLGGTNLTAAGFQDLFASRSLRRLAVLDVGCNYSVRRSADSGAALASLARSPFLSRLVSLDLTYWAQDQRLAPLLEVLQGTRLSALYLHQLGLTDAETRRLAELPQLGSLTTLGLDGNRIGAGGCTVLADSPYLINLLTLDLGFNTIRDQGARALADSPHLRRLRVLRMRRNSVGGPGVTALVQSANLQQLRWLDLAGNHVSTASLRALARSSHLKQLTTLDLGDTQSNHNDAQALTESSQLSRLERLFLDSNDLGDEGAALLAASPTMQRLKLLNLRDNGLGKAGAEALASSRHLGRLWSLDVRENNLTEDEVQLLQRRFGHGVRADE